MSQVDLKKLAELGSYKNAASANTCWYNLKIKLLQQNGKPIESTTLTAAEQKLLALAWQCSENVPKVDLKKLAQLGNYKNPASANTCWYNLKKKLFADEVAGDGTPGAAKTTPKKRANENLSSDDATPKKRGRKPKAVKEEEGLKVGTSTEGAEDSEDDLVVVKPKRGIADDVRALKRELDEQAKSEFGVDVKVETKVEDEEVPKGFFKQLAEYTGGED